MLVLCPKQRDEDRQSIVDRFVDRQQWWWLRLRVKSVLLGGARVPDALPHAIAGTPIPPLMWRSLQSVRKYIFSLIWCRILSSDPLTRETGYYHRGCHQGPRHTSFSCFTVITIGFDVSFECQPLWIQYDTGVKFTIYFWFAFANW